MLYVGYTLTPELVQQLAEPVDGPSISQVAAIARAHHVSIICPYAERDNSGGESHDYDAIAVLDADGSLLHNYRKTHLFGQAERLNYTFGYADGTEDPFCVHLVAGFPVGVLNCYEAEFPELSRILALQGAKLIVIPTAADYYYALPDGHRTHVPYPDVTRTLIPTHAYKKACFIAYCNRSGRGASQWPHLALQGQLHAVRSSWRSDPRCTARGDCAGCRCRSRGLRLYTPGRALSEESPTRTLQAIGSNARRLRRRLYV